MSDPFRGDTWLACSRHLQANQLEATSEAQSAVGARHTRIPTEIPEAPALLKATQRSPTPSPTSKMENFADSTSTHLAKYRIQHY